MSPLELESRIGFDDWVKMGDITPKSRPLSLSNIKPTGEHEKYIFSCSSDNQTGTILRSNGGVGPDDLEVVAALKKGESYEMDITTGDGSLITIRLTQR